MKRLFSILLLSTFTSLWAQNAHLTQVCTLPVNINESSGVIANPDGTLWTNNDSGDKPQIYKIDTLGHLLKTLVLKGATAYDYEDITQDPEGNIYVCDCGNNFNSRQNLCIYKIAAADIKGNWDTVTPEVIKFRYPDQKAFPPSKSAMNFDCESIIIYNDSIFLFSKNRGESDYCKRYSLPTEPGIYTATLLDSTKTRRWVTSAALSPDKKTLILLSENRMNVYTDFTGSDFFHGKHQEIHIPVTQKEGIAFKSNSEIYLTDELFRGFGGKLYYSNLSGLIH